jgi:hypothetical protein
MAEDLNINPDHESMIHEDYRCLPYSLFSRQWNPLKVFISRSAMVAVVNTERSLQSELGVFTGE